MSIHIVQQKNAPLVERLLEAGAIFIVKLIWINLPLVWMVLGLLMAFAIMRSMIAILPEVRVLDQQLPLQRKR